MIPVPKDLTLRDADGLDFAATARESGRASAVLLVHGLLGRREMSELVRVAEALAGMHDVLAIDVRGHGDSPGRFTWGREEWKQVDAAAQHLASSHRAVSGVGFSFGGYHIARAVAQGAPLTRIVLVGAPCDLNVLDHFPFGPKLWRHLSAMRKRGRRRLSAGPLPRRDSALRDDELRAVRVPTLVVHGGDDWLISRRHADRYAAALPAASRLDIPGGFHGEYLVYSHGDALLSAISGFLAAQPSGDLA